MLHISSELRLIQSTDPKTFSLSSETRRRGQSVRGEDGPPLMKMRTRGCSTNRMKTAASLKSVSVPFSPQEGAERPLLSRWAQYLAGRSDNDLCPSPELKALLRAGVPHEYRQRVWSWMVRTRTRTIRDHHPRRYQQVGGGLLRSPVPVLCQTSVSDPAVSNQLLCFQLCEKSRTSPHPASRQIQLDLHRTLTTNQHFSSPSSPALQQLRRILLAFSWQNPAIGYCQGLNRYSHIQYTPISCTEITSDDMMFCRRVPQILCGFT